MRKYDDTKLDKLKIQYRMDELKEQIYEIENRYDFKGMEVIHPVYGFGVASKLMIRKGLDLLEIDFGEDGIKLIGLLSSYKMKLNTPDAEQIYSDFDECYKMKREYEQLNAQKNSSFIV